MGLKKISSKDDAIKLAAKTQVRKQDQVAHRVGSAPPVVTSKPNGSRDTYPIN